MSRPSSSPLRRRLAGLDSGGAHLGHEVAGLVAELLDRDHEGHRAPTLAFLLVDVVDTGLRGELRPGRRRRPVEYELSPAVEDTPHVELERPPSRRTGRAPERDATRNV